MTAELPGIRLSFEEYWKSSKEKRQEFREAFETAYKDATDLICVIRLLLIISFVISRDCAGHGITPVGGALGSSLLWDEMEKKMCAMLANP